jgi:deoxyribodipyrimidine photo-lyase
MKWENNKDHFSKWCEGKTGFPFVDAGMRQLNTEGWMHNRLRMITASFLVKDLLIDWRWGAEYFQEKLLDHDLALNNGGWQWCASTGTDAQPYFRIFNPFSQSEKFDPEGHFIRKYVPELRNVQGKHIHRPFRMSDKEQHHCGCVIGKDYPHPIVDHAKRRERAIVMYRML